MNSVEHVIGRQLVVLFLTLNKSLKNQLQKSITNWKSITKNWKIWKSITNLENLKNQWKFENQLQNLKINYKKLTKNTCFIIAKKATS